MDNGYEYHKEDLSQKKRVHACAREGELPPTGAVVDVSADVSFVASTNRICCRQRPKTVFSRLLGKLLKPMSNAKCQRILSLKANLLPVSVLASILLHHPKSFEQS